MGVVSAVSVLLSIALLLFVRPYTDGGRGLLVVVTFAFSFLIITLAARLSK